MNSQPLAPSGLVLIRPINAGGQGEVWLAEASTGIHVAVKYMHMTGTEEQQAEDRRRFKREIDCQKSLSHPGVLPVLTADLVQTVPFYVMPLATCSLREVLKNNPQGLDETEAVRIFAAVVDAVAHAHANNVIHRDLKPENILMMDSQPMLSDFGLGRRLYSGSTTLTVKGLAWGTIHYSAPEQFSDLHTATPSADVYALGKILYELFTGKIPLGSLDYELVPASYRYAIMTATREAPGDRYASAVDFQREISILAQGPEVLTAPSTRAAEVARQLAAGGPTSTVSDLVRIFIENSSDSNLYCAVLIDLPGTVLVQMATTTRVEFAQIVRTFDTFAAGSHPWEYADKIATFLRAIFKASMDFEVRQIVIRRFLTLGATHNRFFVRDVFVDVVREAITDPMYVPFVADLLRADESGRNFVGRELRRVALPPAILDVMAA